MQLTNNVTEPLISEPQPFTQAVERLSSRSPVGSRLRSADWASVPLQLRERALFSAGIEKVNVLQAIQERLLQWATLNQGERSRVFLDRTKFVAQMRQLMIREGLATGEETLTDPASRQRLELIYNFQTTDATEYGRWRIGQDQDLLDAFPAQEFLRVASRAQPRTDWPQRWAQAGGRTYGGRMIALKSDPVWLNLSRFGRPWPPFDYNSGLGVQDIRRGEAESLGVLAPGARAQSNAASFNQNLRASTQRLSPKLQGALRSFFGDQIDIDNEGNANWRGAA